jgi:hypothetical protein
MSFELILAKDKRGTILLRQLHVKLYLSTVPDLIIYEVKEDRADPFLSECVKSIMKESLSFRESLKIMKLPNIYKDRWAIERQESCERIIIQNKKDDEPDPEEVNPRSMALSLYDAAQLSSPFSMISRSVFRPGRRPPRAAFTGYWDAPTISPPIYLDEEDEA